MEVVSLFRPRDKREAREARMYWRGVKRHGMYAAGTLGGLTTAGVVFAPVPAVACVVAAWFAESKFDALETLASDPPRYDFTVLSEPIERRFYREVLGPSRLEQSILELSNSVLPAAANLNALVRSVERAFGAIEREQPDYVTFQLQVAERFRRESVELLRSMPERVETFARALDDEEELHAAIERAGRSSSRLEIRPDLQLPEKALTSLYRMGVSIRLLREKVSPTWSRDPMSDLTDRLRQASSASARLGETLESWEPPAYL